MEKPAEFNLRTATDRSTISLTGDWTANNLGSAPAGLTAALRGEPGAAMDVRQVMDWRHVS